MKIGIISDIHDNIWKLESALSLLTGTDVLICCGDLCSPFIVDRMAESYSRAIHVVFGNNDADRYRITLRASRYPNFHIHGEFAELELAGKSFAVNHFDNIGRALAASGAYDVVCYGHDHTYHVECLGRTLKINPGEIMGGLSRPPQSTLAVYDTETHTAERVLIRGKFQTPDPS